MQAPPDGGSFSSQDLCDFLNSITIRTIKATHHHTQKEAKKMNVHAEMFANGKSGKEVVMSYLVENGYAYESCNGLMYAYMSKAEVLSEILGI